MGGAYVGDADEGSGLFYNPSCLSQLQSGEVSFYTSQLYGIHELTHWVFVYVQPVSIGSFGFGFSQFGIENYREQLGVLGFSHQWKKILFGGLLKGMNLSLTDFGSDQSLGLDIGVLWKIIERVNLGVTLRNVNKPEMGRGEKLQQSALWGIQLHPVRIIFFNMDWVKYFDQSEPQEIRLGEEILLSDFLALRAGWVTYPETMTGGIGIILRGFQLDYGIRSHGELGLTHSFALSYMLKRE